MPEPEIIQRQRSTPTAVRRAPRTQREKPSQIAPIAPQGCSQRVSETLPLAVERIAQALQPEAIILFGSYAYGAPAPDSDVDLLVVMETNESSAERSWAVSRLLIPRLFPVDILVRTPREIERALAQGDFFIREIVSKGKALYERRQRS